MIPVTSAFLLICFSTEGISVCHPVMTVVSQTSQADVYLSPTCSKPLTVARYLGLSPGQYRLHSVKITNKAPNIINYSLFLTQAQHGRSLAALLQVQLFQLQHLASKLTAAGERELRVKKNVLRSRPESGSYHFCLHFTGQNSLVSPQPNCEVSPEKGNGVMKHSTYLPQRVNPIQTLTLVQFNTYIF